jgi:hypothetical protein
MFSEITEAQFLEQVKQVATINQWLIDHTPTMQQRPGIYRTGGLVGKPDLCLISLRGHGIIYAELKTMDGRLSPAQKIVGNALVNNGAEYYVWRPNQIDLIIERLANKHIAPPNSKC